MDEELQRSLHMGLDMVAVVALAFIMGLCLVLARKGYDDYYNMRALRVEASNKAEFNRYDGEMSPDMLINFVVTYGETYKYAYDHSGVIDWCDDGFTQQLKDKLQSSGVLSNNNWNITANFPLVSVDLIEYFKTAFKSKDDTGYYHTRFKIIPVTAEGVKQELKDCDKATIIVIKEVH